MSAKKDDKIDKLEKENREIKDILKVVVDQNKRLSDQYSEIMKVFNPPASAQSAQGSNTPVPTDPNPGMPVGGSPGSPMGFPGSPMGFPDGMSESMMKRYQQIELLKAFAPMIQQLLLGHQNPMGNILMESQQRMMMENFMAFQMYQRAGIRRMATFGWLTPEEMQTYNKTLDNLPLLTPNTTKLQNLPSPPQGVKKDEQDPTAPK